MNTLLVINSSPRSNSVSRKLTRQAAAQWQAANPNGPIMRTGRGWAARRRNWQPRKRPSRWQLSFKASVQETPRKLPVKPSPDA